MSTSRYITGDVFDVLAHLANEGTQVDLVLTSPPFLALRSYLPADHPDKGKEIGAEATPADFIDTLLDVVEACDRVLTPHGSLVFELGDTFSGSGGAGGDYGDGGLRDGQAKFDGSGRRNRPADVAAGILAPTKRPGPEGRDKLAGWPLAKSLTFMPELFGASLAYGRNLLRPERTTEPWRIRNKIAWVRPNPPVGALGDKFRPAWSMLTVACKARDRWFDLDAVRVPSDPANIRDRSPMNTSASQGHPSGKRQISRSSADWKGTAPPLDWWKISPGGYSGSHYAVFPGELLTRPIEAMCPRRVCRTCGTPSRRETKPSECYATTRASKRAVGKVNDDIRPQLNGSTFSADHETTGWTSCGCPGADGIRMDGYHTGTGWRPGIVLDPFGGSGTTGVVATGLSRDAILIDIDERNADLARERIGMFLTHETIARPAA